MKTFSYTTLSAILFFITFRTITIWGGVNHDALYYKEDINRDNIINSADVVSLYNCIINNNTLVTANVNNDGIINSSDIVEIYNSIKNSPKPHFFMATTATLNNGQYLNIPKNSVKLNKAIELTFDSSKQDQNFNITIGHGTANDYLSSWCVISNNKIMTHCYPTNKNETDITIDIAFTGKTKITIEKELTGTRAILTIEDEKQKQSLPIYWIGDNGNTNGIYASITNGQLYNCILKWGGKSMSTDVWLFGDSFFAIDSPARWTYHMIQDNHTNILLNAYSGAKSMSIIQDFKNLLAISKPKYAIWCLGMNDKDNTTTKYATTPNPNWLNATQEFLILCQKNNITPILATIPTVIGGNLNSQTPTTSFRHHKSKNDWIKQSGIRYVDFAKAVGADDSTGYWIGEGTQEHMLEGTDDQTQTRVHPTIYGAKALYEQFLQDFPEIQNY